MSKHSPSCELHLGDCLEIMDSLIERGVKIDAIITDPPYGTTQCKWDTIIPFDEMWKRLEQMIKDDGAIVLNASQPFTSLLVSSNLDLFKYALVWKKTRVGGFAQAPYKFLSEHEDICVFSKAGCAKNAKPRMKYNPQGLIYQPRITKGKKADASQHRIRKTDQNDFISEWTNYPRSILEFKSEFKTVHPTQKPVPLLEYLISTYSNEGDTILDFTMGSGSCGVAALNLNRRFIGIELDETYFKIAEQRICEVGEIND